MVRGPSRFTKPDETLRAADFANRACAGSRARPDGPRSFTCEQAYSAGFAAAAVVAAAGGLGALSTFFDQER